MLSISQSDRLLHNVVCYVSAKVLEQHIASIYPCSIKHCPPSVVCLISTAFQKMTLLPSSYSMTGLTNLQPSVT